MTEIDRVCPQTIKSHSIIEEMLYWLLRLLGYALSRSSGIVAALFMAQPHGQQKDKSVLQDSCLVSL